MQVAGKTTHISRKTCIRSAAAQAEQAAGLELEGAMPHAEIWELFCEGRGAIDDYSKSSQCIRKANSIAGRFEQLVAQYSAALVATPSTPQELNDLNEAALSQVPLQKEPELSSLYSNVKGASVPDFVAPLTSELSGFEKRVFPSAAQPGNKFQGWGTLISPDDLHVRHFYILLHMLVIFALVCTAYFWLTHTLLNPCPCNNNISMKKHLLYCVPNMSSSLV